MRCEPANSIIEKLGGLSAVAKAAGVTVHTVMRWRMPRGPEDKRNLGGTGGTVPHWHVPKLLAAAKERGVPLTLADFFPDEETAA
jgi:hypothetical protein